MVMICFPMVGVLVAFGYTPPPPFPYKPPTLHLLPPSFHKTIHHTLQSLSTSASAASSAATAASDTDARACSSLAAYAACVF